MIILSLAKCCEIWETTKLQQTFGVSERLDCGCALQVIERKFNNNLFGFTIISHLLHELGQDQPELHRLQALIVKWNDELKMSFRDIAHAVRCSVEPAKLNQVVFINLE